MRGAVACDGPHSHSPPRDEPTTHLKTHESNTHVTSGPPAPAFMGTILDSLPIAGTGTFKASPSGTWRHRPKAQLKTVWPSATGSWTR